MISAPVEFHTWMTKLCNGSPMFGHDFRTKWSFYSIISNIELAAMIPVFKSAMEYQRPLPPGHPEDAIKKMATGLSDMSKEFVSDLIRWFRQLHQAGQDAFIVWT